MGDRVSISFATYDDNRTVIDESIAVFDHWAGMALVEAAGAYAQNNNGVPEEPCFAVVEFIGFIKESYNKDHFDLYLGRTPRDGDNSDNGHYRIDLADGTAQRVDPEYEEEQLVDNLKKENYVLKSQIDRIFMRLDTILKDMNRGGT